MLICGTYRTVKIQQICVCTCKCSSSLQGTVPGKMVMWLMISRAPKFNIFSVPSSNLFSEICARISLLSDSDVRCEHGHIIIVCNKCSILAFHCALRSLCSFAFRSYTMAFLSRNLPYTFNEAKFWTLSILVFLTFLLVYHSTNGKVLVAMKVCFILAFSTGILRYIFVTKWFITLLRQEKNSLHCIENNVYTMTNVLLNV